MIELIPMAAAGTTGNNTHSSVRLDANETVAFQFRVTAVGATPTVTYVIQGSLDDTNWFPIAYVLDSNDTVAVAGRTVTSVAAYVHFLSNPVARRYKHYRLVTSANTNVTYAAEAFRISKP